MVFYGGVTGIPRTGLQLRGRVRPLPPRSRLHLCWLEQPHLSLKLMRPIAVRTLCCFGTAVSALKTAGSSDVGRHQARGMHCFPHPLWTVRTGRKRYLMRGANERLSYFEVSQKEPGENTRPHQTSKQITGQRCVRCNHCSRRVLPRYARRGKDYTVVMRQGEGV